MITTGTGQYCTFRRSCRNWQEFASARKFTDTRNLTYEQAQARCEEFNKQRTTTQIKRGTKMEFEHQ